MIVFDGIRVLILVYAVWWTIYVVALPLVAALRRSKHDSSAPPSQSLPSIAVIVPSHNMNKVIKRCVSALQASDFPEELVQIFVVADHCTDDTASLAEAAGATVLRRDEGPAGKTYTLAWTLEKLEEMGQQPDLYVVTDATARVEQGFLSALVSLYQQGEDIVVSHSLVDAENQKWFARCLGLTLVHRNFQNWARQRLRLSALIEGRGMAYSRKYVDQFGWSLAVAEVKSGSNHPTEDWRHGVQAVEHGMRVAFADDARVITPLRDNLADATKQGARWERGRMANAATNATRLLALGIRERHVVKTLAALDAIQPPVAILGVICVVLAVLSQVGTQSSALQTISLLPILAFFIYGIAVVIRGRRDGISPATVLWAPVYLLWRLTSFVLAWGFLERFTSGSDDKSEKKPT